MWHMTLASHTHIHFQAVAGRYVKQYFDPDSGNFSLTFAADLALAQSNVSTIIFINEKLSYPSGYSVLLVLASSNIDMVEISL
jgi:hypothetical protein